MFRSLRAQLQDLWAGYLGRVSTSIGDYLSVKHLGLIVEHISQLGMFKIGRAHV